LRTASHKVRQYVKSARSPTELNIVENSSEYTAPSSYEPSSSESTSTSELLSGV